MAKLNLKPLDCQKCKIQPRMKFNDKFTLFCFCPCCKDYVRGEKYEMFLEVAGKWNEKQRQQG